MHFFKFYQSLLVVCDWSLKMNIFFRKTQLLPKMFSRTMHCSKFNKFKAVDALEIAGIPSGYARSISHSMRCDAMQCFWNGCCQQNWYWTHKLSIGSNRTTIERTSWSSGRKIEGKSTDQSKTSWFIINKRFYFTGINRRRNIYGFDSFIKWVSS